MGRPRPQPRKRTVVTEAQPAEAQPTSEIINDTVTHNETIELKADKTPLTPFQEFRMLQELPLEPPDENNHVDFFRRIAISAVNSQLWEFDESYLDIMREATEEDNPKEYHNVDEYLKACEKQHTLILAHRGTKQTARQREVNRNKKPRQLMLMSSLLIVFMCMALYMLPAAFKAIRPAKYHAYVSQVAQTYNYVPTPTYYERLTAHLANGAGMVAIGLLVFSAFMLGAIKILKLREAARKVKELRNQAPTVA